MRFGIKRMAAALLAGTMLITGTAGCGGKDGMKVVLTTGFNKDEIFRIEKTSCRLPEIMVYMTNLQNKYEAAYGSDIWNVQEENGKIEDRVKEQVLADVAQIKAMTLLAKTKEITLDEEETALTKQAGKAYFASLNETEKELLDVTEEDITEMYQDYALAEKVYHEIIRDINPEISDDEARKITVQSIFLKTYHRDSDGKIFQMSSEEKEEIRIRAEKIHTKAAEGEDFETLMSQYNEGNSTPYSFGKGEMDPAVEDAAFNLENQEISDIVEAEDGFYIIQCLNTFNREETDDNKLKIMEQRRNEVFGQEYETFVNGLVRRLNEELWSSVEMIHNENVTTSSFYEVYDEIFIR